MGRGITIESAANILIQNNTIFSFYKVGININAGDNITIDGNLVVNMVKRDVILTDHALELTGGIFSCAENFPDSCSDISITNNIVAGSDFSGYVVYGHSCNDPNSNNFKNNFAHSIKGTGAIIYPDPNDAAQSDCMEGSDFYAYKNVFDGAVSGFLYKTVQYRDMVFVDNGYGPSLLHG